MPTETMGVLRKLPEKSAISVISKNLKVQFGTNTQGANRFPCGYLLSHPPSPMESRHRVPSDFLDLCTCKVSTSWAMQGIPVQPTLCYCGVPSNRGIRNYGEFFFSCRIWLMKLQDSTIPGHCLRKCRKWGNPSLFSPEKHFKNGPPSSKGLVCNHFWGQCPLGFCAAKWVALSSQDPQNGGIPCDVHFEPDQKDFAPEKRAGFPCDFPFKPLPRLKKKKQIHSTSVAPPFSVPPLPLPRSAALPLGPRATMDPAAAPPRAWHKVSCSLAGRRLRRPTAAGFWAGRLRRRFWVSERTLVVSSLFVGFRGVSFFKVGLKGIQQETKWLCVFFCVKT